MKWMVLIHTKRGLGVQIRTNSYLWVRTDEIEIWNITGILSMEYDNGK